MKSFKMSLERLDRGNKLHQIILKNSGILNASCTFLIEGQNSISQIENKNIYIYNINYVHIHILLYYK